MICKFFSTEERENAKIGTTHTAAFSVGSANFYFLPSTGWMDSSQLRVDGRLQVDFEELERMRAQTQSQPCLLVTD
jgi:hypothetical protein